MEKDYLSASRIFWPTVQHFRKGKQCSANILYSAGGDLLTSTGNIDGQWNEYFKELLNPMVTRSTEEVMVGDSEVDSAITHAEVPGTQVVINLLGGSASGVDEMHPQYFKSLDVVGLSWLARLGNITWHLGIVPREWQSNVVDTGRRFPTIGGQHFSASRGRSQPEYWSG